MMNNTARPGSIYLKGSSNGILMLHGLTASVHDFSHYARQFSAYDYTVSVPWLKGHGTHVNDLLETRWFEWFQDIKGAYFELRESCKRIVVIGQSVGGSLALHLASHYEVNGLALLAPGIFFKNKATVFAPVLPWLKKFLDKKEGPDIKNPVSKKKAISYLKIPTQSIKEAADLFQHVKMDLAEVYCPTIIFHSLHDHVIDYKSAPYIYRHISSKEKKLITLEDSYHVLSMDNEKNVILMELLKFIKPLFS